MSMRYQAAILTASYFPLKVPNAPTIGTATGGNAQVSLTFTAPSDIGAGAITSYIVTVTDSSGNVFTNTGASSPIVVTGLTNNTTYTAKVAATNAFGTGPNSASSNSFIPANAGQQAYTTPGSYSWVAPSGVTSVSVVAVGGGGGSNPYYGTSGGGGALAYKNNATVVPGNSYTVVVGAFGVGGRNSQNASTSGGDSTFAAGFGTLTASGGSRGPGTYADNAAPGGSPAGSYDGGGNGGYGGTAGSSGGGGGAGGYSGDGGNGKEKTSGSSATAGNGGGGGGGALYGGGGGVGILGQGSSGAAGSSPTGGVGGSGGSNGGVWNGVADSGTPKGGNYGGGGSYQASGTAGGGGDGGPGAVRIIWPGTTRSFPSTNTGDL